MGKVCVGVMDHSKRKDFKFTIYSDSFEIDPSQKKNISRLMNEPIRFEYDNYNNSWVVFPLGYTPFSYELNWTYSVEKQVILKYISSLFISKTSNCLDVGFDIKDYLYA